MLTNPIGRLRLIGLVEGASFLLLLLVAMPLKYAAGMPQAVRIVGMAHGVLFILYGLALVQAWAWRRWSWRRAALLMLSSVLPGGPFVAEGWLRRDELAATAPAGAAPAVSPAA